MSADREPEAIPFGGRLRHKHVGATFIREDSYRGLTHHRRGKLGKVQNRRINSAIWHLIPTPEMFSGCLFSRNFDPGFLPSFFIQDAAATIANRKSFGQLRCVNDEGTTAHSQRREDKFRNQFHERNPRCP